MLTIKFHQILYIIAKVYKRFKIHFQVFLVCYLSFFLFDPINPQHSLSGCINFSSLPNILILLTNSLRTSLSLR